MALSPWRRLKASWRLLIIVLIPLILLPLPISNPSSASKCGYVVLIMAIFWMTEAFPLAVTSLLPVVLFPLLSIMDTDKVCRNYLKETNMMFLGGLMIAIAVEHCNLHRRIALFVMLRVGTSPRWLMFGFMLVTMFLSMWINNTATTAMMVPIVEAIMKELYRDEMGPDQGYSRLELKIDGMEMNMKGLSTVPTQATLISGSSAVGLVDMVKPQREQMQDMEESEPLRGGRRRHMSVSERHQIRFRKYMLLGIAYASNIGGIGTLIATPTNLVFVGIVNQMFGTKSGLNFATWMSFGVPTMLTCVIGAWLWLQFLFVCRRHEAESPEKSAAVKCLIERKYQELGRFTFHEMGVLVLFVILIFLWLFRDPQFIDGWASLLPGVKIKDATSAMAIVVIMFAIPADPYMFFMRNSQGEKYVKRLLDWKVVQQKMPWGIVLLLGGGFAMADAAKVSGLSNWLGEALTGFRVMPPALIVFVVCILTAALTEVASNTATATILLPVLGTMAQSIQVHPLYLMLPAAITCSFAFMLPIATPPNAIVFSSAKMKNTDMLLPGLMMNIMCVGVVTLMINTLGVYVFDLNTFPDWAHVNTTSAAGTVDAMTTGMTQLLTSTMSSMATPPQQSL